MVKSLICRETSRKNNSVMPIILANRSAVGTRVGLGKILPPCSYEANGISNGLINNK